MVINIIIYLPINYHGEELISGAVPIVLGIDIVGLLFIQLFGINETNAYNYSTNQR